MFQRNKSIVLTNTSHRLWHKVQVSDFKPGSKLLEFGKRTYFPPGLPQCVQAGEKSAVNLRNLSCSKLKKQTSQKIEILADFCFPLSSFDVVPGGVVGHSAQMNFCQELKSPPWALCEIWRLFPGRRFRAGMGFLVEVHSDVRPEFNLGTPETCDVTKSCQKKKRQTRGTQEVPARTATVQAWGCEEW